MIIVWGWGPYNRRNAKTAPGTCGSCGYVGLLHSFDELFCFSIFYIPILPLSRRHVWDDCPKCDHGKRLSLRKWRRWMRQDYTESLALLDQERTNREAANSALAH